MVFVRAPLTTAASKSREANLKTPYTARIANPTDGTNM